MTELSPTLSGGTAFVVQNRAEPYPAYQQQPSYATTGWLKTPHRGTAHIAQTGGTKSKGSNPVVIAPIREFESRIFVLDHRIGNVRFTASSLRIELEDADQDGAWVASDGMTSVYGNGSSPEAAENDYLACLVEQFDWLLEHEATLGVRLQRELGQMRLFMVRAS